MKNYIWFLLLFVLSTTLSVKAQGIKPDSCALDSTKTTCQLYISENESSSSDKQLDADASEIVTELSLEQLEEHLNELGYTNITRYKENSLSVMMEGRTCIVYVNSTGTGMSLTTYFAKGDLSLKDLNDWNKSLKYSLAYIFNTEKEEIVVFEMTLLVSGGVTRERIQNVFKLFPLQVAQFNQFILDLPE